MTDAIDDILIATVRKNAREQIPSSVTSTASLLGFDSLHSPSLCWPKAVADWLFFSRQRGKESVMRKTIISAAALMMLCVQAFGQAGPQNKGPTPESLGEEIGQLLQKLSELQTEVARLKEGQRVFTIQSPISNDAAGIIRMNNAAYKQCINQGFDLVVGATVFFDAVGRSGVTFQCAKK